MKFWQQPRQPLAGLLLCAIPGIIAADFWPVDPLLPFILLLALAVLLCLRPSNAGLRWLVVFTFFLLHDFRILDAPGGKLAHEFSESPLPVKAIGIVVSEPQEKLTSKGVTTCRFQLRLESVTIDNEIHPENAVVQIAWMGESPKYGDRVSLTGDAMNVAPPRNPGQFDYRDYLHRLGIDSEIRLRYPNDGEILDGGHGNPVITLAILTRQWMQEKLRLNLDDSPEAAGIIQGMVLGRKNETTDEVRELFQRTGTLHLFVVNGLHIGMFTLIIFTILKWLGARRSFSIIIAIPLIWCYALLTGLNPGSIRASVMATIMLGGWLADGKPLALNNLGAAGFVMLLWDTNELFKSGFQFSMGVVLSIILFAGWLKDRLVRFGTPDEFLPRSLWTTLQKGIRFCWEWISNLIAVSIAASIGSLPFTAIYFHLIAPVALIANPVIVPGAFIVLWLGILSIISATFSTVPAAFLNRMNLYVAHLILWLVHLFAQIPLGHWFVGLPEFKAGSQCEITVLDLAAGAAIHVQAKDQDWLIDCGNKFPYESIVLPYLRSRGINRLDGLILTMGNADHIGAAIAVENYFVPKQVEDSPLADRSKVHRDFRHWASEHGIAETECSRGNVLKISESVKLRVLYPPADLNTSLADDKALVLLLECDEIRTLFMSGSGVITERWLLEHEPGLQSDILVKNQHRSGISGTPDFLVAVRPKVIVCSAGDLPVTAHIDEVWAREVKKRGIQLFRQDRTGAVKIDLRHDHFEIQSVIGDQAFFSSNR